MLRWIFLILEIEEVYIIIFNHYFYFRFLFCYTIFSLTLVYTQEIPYVYLYVNYLAYLN